MIKNIQEIKNKSVEYQSEFFKNCSIEEQIDTHYVSVEILSKSKLVFKKSNEKIITQVDLILSTLYNHLVEDWNILFIKNKEIFSDYIGMKIYMFYFPNTTPIAISYEKYLGDMPVGYLISNIVDKNNKQLSIDNFLKSIDTEGIKAKFDKTHFIHKIYKDPSFLLVDDGIHFFGIEENDLLNKNVEMSEGIIMKYKSDIYKYPFETVPDSHYEDVSRTPFEYLLADIINFYKESRQYFQDYVTNSYVSTVCNIFNGYINYWLPKSNITKEISPSDIEAPSNHKYSLNFSYIPSVETKTLCMTSKLYENIFKVMLANLHKKKKPDYCVYLNRAQVEEWNRLVNYISLFAKTEL